jgi:hypothetical protein
MDTYNKAVALKHVNQCHLNFGCETMTIYRFRIFPLTTRVHDFYASMLIL